MTRPEPATHLRVVPPREVSAGELISDELLDAMVALFTTYDRRAREDLNQALPPDELDREIFSDLLEGPAAAFIDPSRSSADRHLIAFTDGSGARRRWDGTWERVALDQTTLFEGSHEIHLEIHELE